MSIGDGYSTRNLPAKGVTRVAVGYSDLLVQKCIMRKNLFAAHRGEIYIGTTSGINLCIYMKGK